MSAIDWATVRARLAASDLSRSATLDEAGRRAVLARRARRLAERRREEADSATLVTVLTLTIADERYAIDLAELREVVRPPRCTPVPGSGADCLGVVNIHGEITPVLDPSTLLGVTRSSGQAPGHLLLLRAGAVRAALPADRLGAIRRIDLATLNPPAAGGDGAAPTFIRGVTEDLLAVLDVAALLAGTSLRPAGELLDGIQRGGVAR